MSKKESNPLPPSGVKPLPPPKTPRLKPLIGTFTVAQIRKLLSVLPDDALLKGDLYRVPTEKDKRVLEKRIGDWFGKIINGPLSSYPGIFDN